MSKRDTGRADIAEQAGATSAQFPTHGGIKTGVNVDVPDEADSTVKVAGFHYDDLAPSVQIKLHAGQVDAVATLSPERAREIAADLEAAADLAETGDS